jgi:hypothetical protein
MQIQEVKAFLLSPSSFPRLRATTSFSLDVGVQFRVRNWGLQAEEGLSSVWAKAAWTKKVQNKF